MTYLSDLIRGGYWGLQHHEKKTLVGKDWKEELRLLRFGARVTHVRGRKELRQQGPITGGLVWDSKTSGKNFPNVWSFASPTAPNGSGDVSLVKGPKWSETVSGVETHRPAFNNEQQYPAGWSSVTLAGVDFDKQNLVSLAGFDGIVAPHFSNVPALGTPVWELNGRGLGARARFQSLSRLYQPPTPTQCLSWGDGHHLALQLGRSTDGAGYLVFADDPDKLTTGGLQDLATGNKRGGGPFDVGGGTCPHVHGVNARGETMRALHFTTGALFRGGIGDGPLRFQSKLYDQFVYNAPFKTKVRILWNPERIHSWGCGVANGVWEPQGESFFSLVIPPEKPPGELIPRFPSEPLVGGGDDEFDPSQPPDPSELGPDGSPLFSRNSNFIDPRSFGCERIGNFRETSRPLYGSSLEMAFPGIVGRAQHYSKKKHDLRSIGKSLSDEQIKFWACLPATMRHEYYGAQTEDGFVETQSKHKGRYQNVPTANGGRVNMPPELGLEHLIDGYDDLTGIDYSTPYDVDWHVRRARGTPILTGTNAGGVADGFSDYLDTANDRWVTYHHDSDGNATLVREYDAQGRDRKLCIGTYGDGRAGDVTISSTTTYTENKFFENLELNASQTVIAKNLGIFVKDTLTINASASINADGESGESGTEGGAAGGGVAANYYGESGGGGDGNVGAAGSAGSAPGPSLGGDGGDGGAGEGGANAGGSGGSVSPPDHWPAFLESILMGLSRDLSAFSGGGGGGGGGAGAGVQGPGGGGGAGVLLIVARHLVLNTTGGSVFTAIGGRGGDGATTNSGGAGGGGGGFVCVVYQTAEDHEGNQLSKSQVENLISVAGADGGTLNGSGGKGNPGSNGNKIVFKHG